MIKVEQFVNSIFQSNTWILYKEDQPDVWLIDCGDFEPLHNWLTNAKKTVKGILLTHSHFDHIYGLNLICKKYPEATVYCSENGKKSLNNSRWNFSFYHNTEFFYDSENVETINEDSKMEIFPETKLKIISTPGHDWSCLTFQAGNYIFTGDSYIPGLKVVTTFPKSNKQQAAESLQKIFDLTDIHTIICPGHGKMQ